MATTRTVKQETTKNAPQYNWGAKPRAAKTASAKAVDATASRFNEYFGEDSFVVKNPWAGIIANLTVSVVGVYSSCSIAGYIGLAAALFTGSAFLGFLASFIAGFILIIQSLRAGAVVGKYVSTGQFEHDYTRAKDWVTGKFSSITKRGMASA